MFFTAPHAFMAARDTFSVLAATLELLLKLPTGCLA